MNDEKYMKMVQPEKYNGSPYAEGFDEAYVNMSDEERKETDSLMSILTDLIGSDEN